MTFSLAEQAQEPTADWPVVDFLSWWMSVEGAHFKPATQRNAAHAIRKWSAALGPTLRLGELSRTSLQRVIDDQLEAGAAPGTVRVDFSYVATALRLASADRIIEHDPTLRVRPPKRLHAQLELPSEGELLRFLRVSLAAHRAEQAEWFGPLVGLALLTGMRRNELAGLRWHNVHIDGLGEEVPMRAPEWRSPIQLAERLESGAVGEIRVVEQIYYQSRDRFAWVAPKSAHGVRRIPLPPDLADVLRAQYARVERARARAGTRRWREHDLVFPGRFGWPASLHVLDVTRRRLAAAVGISPAPTFHLLRHAFISLLVESGLPQPTIVRLVGHADGRVIERVYYSVMQRGMDDAARVIQRRAAFGAERRARGLDE